MCHHYVSMWLDVSVQQKLSIQTNCSFILLIYNMWKGLNTPVSEN